jgi:hypothetical protein
VAGYDYTCSFASELITGHIKNCFTVSTISGSYGSGGFCQWSGVGDSGFQSNYYDSQIQGNFGNLGATPKTTAEMKTQSTFVGWDFVNVWKIIEGQTYPELRAAYTPLQISIAPSYQKVAQGQNAAMTSTVTGG